MVDAQPVDHSDEPAGATTRTRVEVHGTRVEVWDGLVDGRLVRRFRGIDGDLDVTHRVDLGGFDGTPRTDVVETALRAARGAIGAIEITGVGVRRLDPDLAAAELRAADERFLAATRTRPTRSHPDRVRDAFAVMQACTYEPTGATIASPTTSLPEAVGADRQFDYRYAWLRDASLAASVVAVAGRLDAATEHLRFVTSLGRRLFEAPLFTVDGRPAPEEREVAGVSGWAGSRPVRVGNAAIEQVQFDALGFVVEAVSTYTREGGRLDRGTWRLVRAIAERCCEGSPAKTSGIWELREPREVLSADIGRWIALDRAVRVARRRRPWARRRGWIATRDALRDGVLAELRSDGRLPQEHGGDPDDLDASALLVVMFGILDTRDPRADALVDAHLKGLGEGPHLRRYRPGSWDGFEGIEGCFVPCGWWAVTALAAVGRLDEAVERADALCRALPRLLPEEVDPETNAGLGNAGLVWSHTEMTRALHVLDVAGVRARWGQAGVTVRSAGRRLRRRTESLTRRLRRTALRPTGGRP
jgi:GH15 family glucan-1,4-alpha-glucosidase